MFHRFDESNPKFQLIYWSTLISMRILQAPVEFLVVVGEFPLARGWPQVRARHLDVAALLPGPAGLAPTRNREGRVLLFCSLHLRGCSRAPH